MKVISQNFILVGSFNTALITPAWLDSEDIYKIAEIEVQIDINSQALRYILNTLKVSFEIQLNKFIVTRIDPTDQKLEKKHLSFVYQIFEKLKYTPISAIGYNIELELDLKEHSQPYKILNDLSLIRNDKIIQSNFMNQYKLGDKTLTVIYKKKENKYTCQVNIQKLNPARKDILKEISGFTNNINDLYKEGMKYVSE